MIKQYSSKRERLRKYARIKSIESDYTRSFLSFRALELGEDKIKLKKITRNLYKIFGIVVLLVDYRASELSYSIIYEPELVLKFVCA